MADKTINFTFKVDGTLTDVTSAVLSDPTGTFGVKRNDTDAVVVADGTAMTKQSTGTYQHTFTEPTAGLIYTAYIEVEYDGATYHFERQLTGAISAPTSGITLEEAENMLSSSVVHGGEGFGTEKLRRAIRASGNRLMVESGLGRTVLDVTASAGSNTVNIASVNPDFLAGKLFEAPFIADDFYQLKNVAFANIRAEIDRGEASGRPELISFFTPTQAYFYPTPDKQYTISLPWVQPLTSFDLDEESPENIALNVPTQYVDDWIWWGARAYLLMGAPGHHDDRDAMREFIQLIERVKGDAFNDGVLYADRLTDFGHNHGFGSFV